MESGASVRGLFTPVLHLGDAGAELNGSLGQDGGLAKTQPPGCQSEEELLSDATGERQVGLLPHGEGVQEAHHLLVQVGEPAGTEENH